MVVSCVKNFAPHFVTDLVGFSNVSFDIYTIEMAAEILYFISEACENLFMSLSSLEEKNSREEIIIDHIKLCAEKKIQIGDFRNSWVWTAIIGEIRICAHDKQKT